MPAFCKPARSMVITASILPTASLAQIVEALCWSHARRKFGELADMPPCAARQTMRRRSRRSRWRPSNASTRFSASNARSMAFRSRSGWRRGGAERPIGRRARGMDARRARETLRGVAVSEAIDYMLTRWRKPSACLTMGGFASRRTMRPSAPYVVWLWAGSPGYSPDRGAGAEERAAICIRLIHTASSSTPLTRRFGWPTSSPDAPIIQ